MEIFTEIKSNLFPASSAALGFFDGVHLGHVEIIKNAVILGKEKGLKSVVVTFSNHPHTEITGQAPKLLTTIEERLELIKTTGADAVLALEFNSKLRRMSAQDYFTKILVESINAKFISIGYDHKFGFNQEGSPEKLKEWGKKLGIEVKINIPVNINDEPVSSTRIRKDISAGQVKAASKLLGRHYSFSGTVTQGLKRGTELGFPTANLMISSEIVIPATGVYAGFALIENENKKLPSVINVGYCPTFKDDTSEVKTEVHILDFPKKELYGKKIKVYFVERLRSEEKFNTKEELISQIKKDCEQGKKLLSA
jgi:riboflavin kinase/FMN adenylyltransferase